MRYECRCKDAHRARGRENRAHDIRCLTPKLFYNDILLHPFAAADLQVDHVTIVLQDVNDSKPFIVNVVESHHVVERGLASKPPVTTRLIGA
jgi:hypothetical protein